MRVYKFEEEELVTCSQKETLDIRLAQVKRSGNGSSRIAPILGAEAAMIRTCMHCFCITRLDIIVLLQGWWSGHAGPLFHKCGVAGWLGRKGLQKRGVPCMEIS